MGGASKKMFARSRYRGAKRSGGAWGGERAHKVWKMDTLEIECCIRGYHVYQDVWEAAIDEELVCRPERSNGHDRYAVAVMKNDLVVGHLPSKFSRLYTLFIRRGGVILCRVAGRRRYSRDLPQGGLEIPCALLLKGPPKELKKLKKLKSTCT